MHGPSGHHHHKHPKKKSDHFHGSSILDHILHKRAAGLLALSETHGSEIPTWIAIGMQMIKDTTIILVLTGLVLKNVEIDVYHSKLVVLAMGSGWIFWKATHIAWLAWMKLERLHRLLEEEHYELEENREQEKEELKVLYAAKGLSGRLLDEVIDVMMADDQRALHIMLQEELGLVLGAYDHPLKQAVGAFVGGSFAFIFCALAWVFFSFPGLCTMATTLLLVVAFLTASLAQNRVTHAVVWNLSLGALALSLTYFLWNACLFWHKYP